MDGLAQPVTARPGQFADAVAMHAAYRRDLQGILPLAQRIGAAWHATTVVGRAKSAESIWLKHHERGRGDRPLRDGVAITMAFEPQYFRSDVVSGIIGALKAERQIPEKTLGNYNIPGSRDYRLQTHFEAANGRLWEMHFRLAHAWEMAQLTHPRYEVARLPTTSRVERVKIADKIVNMMAQIELPAGVLEIGVPRPPKPIVP